MAKTTMVLAFGLVNWRVLETLRVAMAAVLEGQQRMAANQQRMADNQQPMAVNFSIGAAGNGMLLREETKLRVQAEMEQMMTAEIKDVYRRAAARAVLPAASIAFFFSDLNLVVTPVSNMKLCDNGNMKREIRCGTLGEL
ncbi:hypothetical protein EDC01DRAFT_657082 [Geopyxis carbonaria]|nr:hypothetical protein EDC01DRAFT_657082 [Geopyxis carbonaria]